MKAIPLGFEVGTGNPVTVPLRHMVITGMTQQAGKTTALEALVDRSGVRAVTFITKRGEGAFDEGRRIPPYFKERADWQFVGSLIDATLNEKNKFIRSWLMKVCRGTKTLAEVYDNVVQARATSKRGIDEGVYTEIQEYLELVIPQLSLLPPARALKIQPGLNVIDLAPYSTELQGLVIRSVIEHVYEHEENVVTVIPEAWEFLPEGRGSPVKLAAETLIRKGAALNNYMWVDAQDLGGIWKTVVRAAAVYLVGVQREGNEIKRTLGNLPASAPKLKPADVASLGLGEFYVCYGQSAVRTYVWPRWLNQDQARRSAELNMRLVKPETLRQRLEDGVTKDEATQLERENARLAAENSDLKATVGVLKSRLDALEGRTAAKAAPPVSAPAPAVRAKSAPPDAQGTDGYMSPEDERLYLLFLDRLKTEEPALALAVAQSRPEIKVVVTRRTIEVDGNTPKGRIAALFAKDFFREPKTQSAVRSELRRTGAGVNSGSISTIMESLTKDGFFVRDGGGYQAVDGMHIYVTES